MKQEKKLIAKFMGLEYGRIGYNGTPSETLWQLKNDKWLNKPNIVKQYDNSIGEYFVSFTKNLIISIEDIDYKNNWNHLMPVVKKIECLYSENFPADFVQKVLAKEQDIIDHHYMDVIALPLASDIKEAYKNVVKFIKWYNSKV